MTARAVLSNSLYRKRLSLRLNADRRRESIWTTERGPGSLRFRLMNMYAIEYQTVS